jgi:hypothetical protein
MSRQRDEDRQPSEVPGYRGFGGVYAGTASLAHLLAHHSVGAPVGESAVLAAGGGLGFSYNAYPGHWGVHVALTFEVPAGAGVVARAACDRLGAPARVDETGNGVVAERALLKSLRVGQPCLLWGAKGELPYYRLRDEVVPLVEHQWVAYGYDPEDDEFLVADLAPGPLRVSRHDTAAARSGLFSAKHRKLTLEMGRAAAVDPDAAARRGLRAGLEAYRVPLLPGQGLNGLARWADLMVDTESPKGWPQLFNRWQGSHFYDALVAIYEAIEITHGGGALRGLLALYLDRAGAHETAARYRQLASAWSGLAHAALPSSIPQLAHARRLLSERDRLLREEGPGEPGTGSRLAALDEELSGLRQRAESAPILTESEAADFRRDLSRRVLDLHRSERAAADDLSRWLGG